MSLEPMSEKKRALRQGLPPKCLCGPAFRASFFTRTLQRRVVYRDAWKGKCKCYRFAELVDLSIFLKIFWWSNDGHFVGLISVQTPFKSTISFTSCKNLISFLF